MKHLLAALALFVSMANGHTQTPYNPDSDNNQLIGANDLQSILAVYGNSFSSGFITDSASMAVLQINGSCTNHQFVAPAEFQGNVLVFDGSQREGCDYGGFTVEIRTVDSQWFQPFNGLQLVFLRSPGQNEVTIYSQGAEGGFEAITRNFPHEGSYNFTGGSPQGYFAPVDCATSQYGCGEPFHSITSIVFWNGNWYLRN